VTPQRQIVEAQALNQGDEVMITGLSRSEVDLMFTTKAPSNRDSACCRILARLGATKSRDDAVLAGNHIFTKTLYQSYRLQDERHVGPPTGLWSNRYNVVRTAQLVMIVLWCMSHQHE